MRLPRRCSEAASFILLLKQSRPQVENYVDSLTLLREHGEEPLHGVQLWVDGVARKHVANRWVVVFQQQPQKAEAGLQADEVVVEEHRWQECVHEEMHGLQTHCQWVLDQAVLNSGEGTAVFEYLVLVSEPHEAT